ncbi:MAG: hypothetical protein GEU99_05200 [Luteitalea sp.]|nr:hypothetical protein [Luteitalea sp.]
MESSRRARWVAATGVAITLLAGGPSAAVARTQERGPTVVTGKAATPREEYAAERLRATLATLKGPVPAVTIRIGVRGDALFGGRPVPGSWTPETAEAFQVERTGNEIAVMGSDPSGALYGALDLSERITRTGRLPATLSVSDRPRLKIRGTNLFWMKFGERGYNWAITPEHFPWFFDRAQMTRYLDALVASRYNTIFFWTAHPFPYLLRLPKYPEAQSLGDAELLRNVEHFRWFTKEADRRGIWTVLHFYNIHVPPSFAKAHEAKGIRIENHQATPLLVDYTRYCVSEFVKTYPSVGLMLTAGEALSVGREEFIRDAIVAGIEDSGKKPPLIVRQWVISPTRFRDIVKPSYDNLLTMMKHNTEMLVSPHPEARNRIWAGFGDHIINVHENTDLKPLRWGSPLFIRETVERWHEIGAAGFHLYPMVSWQWPVSLDDVSPRLSTVDRDWIWLEAFGRYGWNADRDAAQEQAFWLDRLAARFGAGGAAAAVYDYYVKTGPVLPGLQNVINIYNMNFHPTAVGQEATLNGILRSDRWNYLDSPLAAPLDAYSLQAYEARYGPMAPAARRRPPRSIKEIVKEGRPGVEAVDPLRLSRLFVTMASEAHDGLRGARPARNLPEYERFLRDAEIVFDLARFYAAKLEASYEKGLYDTTGDARHFARMLTGLAESVRHYEQVERLASAAYRQATDLADWYRWSTTLESFREELAFYEQQRARRAAGAEVVYLGLDGPMNDASNVFHWLLEQQVVRKGWSSQSYAFTDDYLRKAKLAIVYETRSQRFSQEQSRLLDWVRAGGKLIVWDPLARAAADQLLEGISFWSDESYEASPSAGFSDLEHPLLAGVRGSAEELDGVRALHSSVRSASPDWTELAYTVLYARGRDQVWYAHRTFGPRWTSLMNPARVPIMLARKVGRGEIVLMQTGVAMSSPRRSVGPDPGLPAPPSHLATITANLVAWASR